MKSALPCVLTLNGGSSSIRFAVYEAGKTPRRQFYGKIDRIGVGGTNLVVIDPAGKTRAPYRLRASDYRTAVRRTRFSSRIDDNQISAAHADAIDLPKIGRA